MNEQKIQKSQLYFALTLIAFTVVVLFTSYGKTLQKSEMFRFIPLLLMLPLMIYAYFNTTSEERKQNWIKYKKINIIWYSFFFLFLTFMYLWANYRLGNLETTLQSISSQLGV